MTETIIKRKWFWAWQDFEEEQWLESMAERGYHLLKPGFFGRYVFKKGEPKQMAYRLDFHYQPNDLYEYLQVFEDAGWEYIGQFGSWQYFRKPITEDEQPEIFTDVESKIKKYQRVLTFIVILIPIYLLPLNMRNILSNDPVWLMVPIFLFWLAILIFLSVSVVMIIRRIDELKKTIRQ
jgi:hypothetical protein